MKAPARSFVFLCFIALCFGSVLLNAQTANYSNLDSLRKTYQEASNDSMRVSILYDIVWAYMYTNSDSSILLGNEALEIAKRCDYQQGIADSYYVIGYAYYLKGDYLNALDYFLKCEQKSIEIEYTVGIMVAYNGIGGVYNEQFEFDEAHEYFERSLKIATEIKRKRFIGYLSLNLGEIHYKTKEYEVALEYFINGNKVLKEENDTYGYSLCYTNICETYFEIGDLDSTMKYVEIALPLSKQIQNQELTSRCYLILSKSYHKDKDLNTSIDFAKMALNLAYEIGSLKLIKNSSFFLYQLYTEQHNYQKALENYKINTMANDSMFNTKKQNELNRLIHLDAIEKKDKEMLLMEKDKELAKTQLLLISIALIAALILGILIYRSGQKEKKSKIILAKQNKIIEENNNELNQSNEELNATLELVSKQKDEIAVQHKLVVGQNKDITDSINYAKMIQTAVLPNVEEIEEYLQKHFILFKPRDIVSGDFYWFKKIKNHFVICVADCTGHGVPGAFMSMLGISFLNDIVTRSRFDSAGEILDRLREKVKKSLKQSGESGESKDGMDIALCRIDLEHMSMQYAGANNPMIIIRGSNESSELMYIKADRQPIGIYFKEDSFHTNEITLQKGDLIYLFSDGYIDQFGGEKGRKFKIKQFKDLLLTIKDKDMNEQKEILDSTIEKWKSHTNPNGKLYEQLDDILIIGFRI